jgi:tetratricopeptide (TPR) repeat protein
MAGDPDLGATASLHSSIERPAQHQKQVQPECSTSSSTKEADTVDQQTRAALKKDKFVTTTTHGLEWASENRQSLIVNGGILLGVILVAIISVVVYNSRSEAASVAFGAAMQAYQTPLAQAGQAVPPGVTTYPSIAERAKAANALFLAVADKYGMTPDGRNALYFAGLTYVEAGQNPQAEDTLKKVAGSWDSNLAALGKFALAQLYHDTGRDPQAIDLYNQLSAKSASTVPYGMAQLQLAYLYQSEGKADDARKIYASLKDKDPKGAAGLTAAGKLNPSSAPAPQQP